MNKKTIILLAAINIISFMSLAQSITVSETMTDPRDGKTYKTVQIGNQNWLAENLAYKPDSGNYRTYDNKPDNVNLYGYLYEWDIATQVCPVGWHLPTKDDFEQLLNNYPQLTGEALATTLLTAGTSRFEALFAGYCNGNAEFKSKDSETYFWSSTTRFSNAAWRFSINANNAEIGIAYRNCGFSVRCIKD